MLYCVIVVLRALICSSLLICRTQSSRKTGELVGTISPNEAILRLIKVRSLGKQPYFAKKNAAKLNAVKKSKFNSKPSTAKGSVVAMAYLERKKQLVVSTSDCFISFWNPKLQHLVDFVQVEIPQVSRVLEIIERALCPYWCYVQL